VKWGAKQPKNRSKVPKSGARIENCGIPSVMAEFGEVAGSRSVSISAAC
jgi:hypothetical protein